MAESTKEEWRGALSTPGVQAQKVRGRSVIDKLNNADLVVDGRPHHVI
jgi:hypothetical protein